MVALFSSYIWKNAGVVWIISLYWDIYFLVGFLRSASILLIIIICQKLNLSDNSMIFASTSRDWVWVEIMAPRVVLRARNWILCIFKILLSGQSSMRCRMYSILDFITPMYSRKSFCGLPPHDTPHNARIMNMFKMWY